MTTAFRFRRARRAVWLPDRAAVAGVFLAVLMYFLCFYQPVNFEPEPYVRLPLSKVPQYCFNVPDKGTLIVSIDAEGRSYFATDSREVQAATIQQVAARYNVQFSATQQQALAELPYLGLGVRQLPAYLSLPRSAQRRLALPGLPQHLSDDQLAACIQAGRSANIRILNSAPFIALRADARTSAADIKRFMHTLQRQHLHRFYAIWQYY